jgi:hypothetical protein
MEHIGTNNVKSVSLSLPVHCIDILPERPKIVNEYFPEQSLSVISAIIFFFHMGIEFLNNILKS